MKITRNAEAPTEAGPADYFTGTVRLDNRAAGDDPSRVTTAIVTFEKGARTNWHIHPIGQTLIVTAGKGWVQRDGGAVETVLPGDTIFFAKGEKHWHGATRDTAMSHIAITENDANGSGVEWLEAVTDDQYRA